MADDMDLYDEGTELDQEGTVRDGADKAEKNSYESFLGPKSAFAGKDISVGAIHRVKFDRILDSEIEMHCISGKGSDEPESADNTSEETDDMYS